MFIFYFVIIVSLTNLQFASTTIHLTPYCDRVWLGTDSSLAVPLKYTCSFEIYMPIIIWALVKKKIPREKYRNFHYQEKLHVVNAIGICKASDNSLL